MGRQRAPVNRFGRAPCSETNAWGAWRIGRDSNNSDFGSLFIVLDLNDLLYPTIYPTVGNA